MTPEQKARVSIDTLLVVAGWHVCNVSSANLHAATGVAIREFPLNNGFGFADYLLYVNGNDRHLSIIREVEAEVDANLQRSQALWQSTLAKTFSGGVVNG